jgi:hypothetical protein
MQGWLVLPSQAVLRRKPEWQKKLTQRISKHSSLPMQARHMTRCFMFTYSMSGLV